MKASEIMIGDLVKLKTDNDDLVPCKIGEIGSMLFVFIDGDEIMDGINYDDVEGIPLTEEILKANGFRFIDEKRLFFVPDEGGSISYQTVTHFVSVGCDGSVRKNIGFVHEFQHALRLCGLNDMADNFRIGGEE